LDKEMKGLGKEARIGISLFIAIIIIVIAYIAFVTVVAQVAMPDKANGSLIYIDGRVVGSELIGQSFTSPGYFHGRPSAVNYDGGASGGSNLGPSSEELLKQVSERVEQVRKKNGLAPDAPVPADLVLTSGSGLDPDISVDSAMLQVSRVASERGLSEADVIALVERHIDYPQLGFLGSEHVNVLKLNIALDELSRGNK
jgi:potassium-transporting ATPase KdpC subunit